MANRKYLILYPDGSRSYVDVLTRDDMQASGFLKAQGERRYKYTGPMKVIRRSATKDWESPVKQPACRSSVKRMFGTFIFQFGEKRTREACQLTDYGLEERIRSGGWAAIEASISKLAPSHDSR